MHELPQSYCGDNREGALFFWLHLYIAPISLMWDLSTLCILMTTFIYILLWCRTSKFEVFFQSLEDDKEHVWNKPTLNRKLSYEMTDPKGPIYIKTNVFLYLVECNVIPINVFTLELCLNIVIRNGRTSFCFLWLWSQNYFWDWTKRVNPMKCNVNGLTFLSLIG